MMNVMTMVVMWAMQLRERCACGFGYGAAVTVFGTLRGGSFV